MTLWNAVRQVFRCLIKTLFTLWLLIFGFGLVLTSYDLGGLAGLLIVVCLIGSGVVHRMGKTSRETPDRPAPLAHDSEMAAFDLPASHPSQSLTLISNGD